MISGRIKKSEGFFNVLDRKAGLSEFNIQKDIDKEIAK